MATTFTFQNLRGLFVSIPAFLADGQFYYAEDTNALWVGSTTGNKLLSGGAAPGGSTGDIQFNNAGSFAGSSSTITAAGSITLPASQVIEWSAGLYPATISYLGLGTLAIGAGSAGDVSGGLGLSAILLYDGTHFTTIEGNATTNWTFKFPVNAGTSGYLLSTDGVGNTSWIPQASGSGTVTSVSAGNLNPLFTTSVANPTTTPALSFSLNTQVANTAFMGPVSGGPSAPTFRAFVAADMVAAGLNGDIQYNNNGALGGSASTITAAGSFSIPSSQIVEWSAGLYPAAISYLGLGTLAIGAGAAGDVSGGIGLSAILLYDGTHFTTIEGNATTNWTFKFPVNAGTSGQVLQTDGSGNTSWAALSSGTAWSALTNAVSNLTLANGANTTTFDQTTGALWTWANTTPLVAGAVGTVALSTTVAPTNAGGNNWVYTLGASASGAGSNGWAGAAVTVSGYTGGATGNNGASLPITASTTTTVTITNPTGTVTNTGTPAMISTAVVQSPAIVLSGAVGGGTAGTLNSVVDTWTIQVGTQKSNGNNPAPTGPNPNSALTFLHTGSSGNAYVQIPNLQGLPSSDIHIDLQENGGNVIFTNQGGTNNLGSIAMGGGPGSFGLKGQISGKTTFVEGNVMVTTVPCIAFSSTAACTLTSGTGICVAFGSGGGVGNPGTDTFTFNPASGTAAFQCVLINPIIEGTSSGATTALLVNPTYTLTNLTGTNLLLDLQNSGTSEFNVNTSGVVGKVAGLTTTKNGIAATLATSLLTAQTAAISAQALVSSASAYPKGMWRISFVATATTASTGSALGGTTGFQITFTNGNGDAVVKTTSQTAVVSVGTSTADTVSGDFYAYAGASSNITYSFGYTAGTGPLAYDIAVYAEFIG